MYIPLGIYVESHSFNQAHLNNVLGRFPDLQRSKIIFIHEMSDMITGGFVLFCLASRALVNPALPNPATLPSLNIPPPSSHHHHHHTTTITRSDPPQNPPTNLHIRKNRIILHHGCQREDQRNRGGDAADPVTPARHPPSRERKKEQEKRKRKKERQTTLTNQHPERTKPPNTISVC